MPREAILFYRSWAEGASHMKQSERRALYEALINYALFGEEPKSLSESAMTLFPTAKAQIDKNNLKYAGGKTGGRPKNETNGFEK